MNIQGLEIIENIPLDIMIDNIKNVKYINGIFLEINIEYNKCQKCNNYVFINKSVPMFFYCSECNINLCYSCDIKYCKTHYKYKRMISPERIYIICNVCDNVFYSDYIYRNYKTNLDCCLACSLTDDGRQFIKDNDLDFYHYKNKYGASNFGKLYDWNVIYKDDEENYIIYCDNINSHNYGCYGLYATDNMNKIGLYSLSKRWKLEDFKIILENYYNDIEWKLMTGLYYFNNFPIKRFMKNNNMLITYSL